MTMATPSHRKAVSQALDSTASVAMRPQRIPDAVKRWTRAASHIARYLSTRPHDCLRASLRARSCHPRFHHTLRDADGLAGLGSAGSGLLDGRRAEKTKGAPWRSSCEI